MSISDKIQLFLAIVTTASVLALIVFNLAHLREARIRRKADFKPHLKFRTGGFRIPIEFNDSFAILGLHYPSVAHLTRYRPSGKNRMDALYLWGSLMNVGNSTALNVRITFRTIRRYAGQYSEKIDDHTSTRFPYLEEVNSIPCSPSELHPGMCGSFLRLPTPIVCDYFRVYERFDFVIKIEYQDMFSNNYTSWQGMRAFVRPEYLSQNLVLFTFCDCVEAERVDMVEFI